MTISKLRRDIEIVRRALIPKDKGQENPEKAIREYMEWFEKATEGMSRAEKLRFDHELAKQVAKDYAEGRI